MKNLNEATIIGGAFVSEDSEETRADRRSEVELMRQEGYSSSEIAAMLSTDKWSGYSSM